VPFPRAPSNEYVSAAQAAGVNVAAAGESWGDQQIEQALFPQRPALAVWRKHPEPDWSQIHQELQTHKDLTLQLVWQEGRESKPSSAWRRVPPPVGRPRATIMGAALTPRPSHRPR